ncbi:TPA: hypothetical protein N0F65_002384 [Lagenidium giganteum]|uniref:Uncharacterized protein n=1 Tax=Lagenidium giganteum TaxID=4803 RepID=A0AAV2YL63_9STRA|nr:TPA: hypothetical protein N0F65_002384 [Lagenidium giganteum]
MQARDTHALGTRCTRTTMRLPTTIALVLGIALLWLVGVFFTPKDEVGVLAISVADAILMHIRPWVFFTAGFYHPHALQVGPIDQPWLLWADGAMLTCCVLSRVWFALVWQLVFVLPLAFGLAKRVEPDMGSVSLARMLAFANICATFVLFVDMFCLYIIFREPAFLQTNNSGFTGGITALLVAYMKPTPFAVAPFIPGLQLRFYPLLACVIFGFCSLAGVFSTFKPLRSALIGAGPYAVLGGYFGWYYLRFLKRNPDLSRGDFSDDFALVNLFPGFMAPVIGPAANFCLNVVKLCGYFKNRSTKAPQTLPVVAPTPTDAVAERRNDDDATELVQCAHWTRSWPSWLKALVPRPLPRPRPQASALTCPRTKRDDVACAPSWLTEHGRAGVDVSCTNTNHSMRFLSKSAQIKQCRVGCTCLPTRS